MNILVEKGKDILFLDLNLKQNGFAQKFHDKHGVYPNIFSTFIYETVRIFGHTIQPNDSKENSRVKLTNLRNFATDIGSVEFNADGEINGIETVIKQLQPDGSAKIIKE